jgi:segregation and condensation protein A
MFHSQTSRIAETEAYASEGRRYLLEDFEGPLDLLLFLIRKNEVSVYDIPISSITEQFLACLDGGKDVDLDDLSDFYAMAATLLYIKSKMLLPVDLDLGEDMDDPRDELIEKLIEFQKYKKISELMERREMEVEWSVERAKIQRQLPFADEGRLWDKLDVWDLLKTFSSLVGSVNTERIIDMYEEVSIAEKIALVHELLAERESFLFTDLIARRQSTMDFVCAFLALLESVKYRVISIYQHRLFGDIVIRRYGDSPEEHHGNEA